MVTKSIQLVGIGNGLVDMQYRVSDSLLAHLGVPKGGMRLVEPSEQLLLLGGLGDLVPHRCGGGSATNTLDSFARFGGSAYYLTVVGDDGNGKYYYKELSSSGITYKSNILSNISTGTCLVLITPDGERTMLTSLGASKQFSLEHLEASAISSSEWLYIEGYKFSESSGARGIAEAIDIAVRAGTKVAVSASDVYITTHFRDLFMGAIARCDLLFCNASEACSIAGCADADAAFVALTKLVPNVVMTMGSSGSRIQMGGQVYDIAAIRANVIDTTGAGDMYAGAFLYGIINFTGADAIERSGKLASLASGIIVSQLGARYTGSFSDILASV